MEVRSQIHAEAALRSREEPPVPIAGWVGPRAGLITCRYVEIPGPIKRVMTINDTRTQEVQLRSL
jgi:2-keto-3-deoxy-galactonokinase